MGGWDAAAHSAGIDPLRRQSDGDRAKKCQIMPVGRIEGPLFLDGLRASRNVTGLALVLEEGPRIAGTGIGKGTDPTLTTV